MSHIVSLVASKFSVTVESIVERQKGRQGNILPRKIAMYLCQLVGYSLNEQVERFGVSHPGTISNAITLIRRVIEEDKALARKIDKLKKRVWT